MVFLRLTVKIYPREQLQPTSSFSFRAILGDRGSDRDDSDRTSSGSASGKPANFLIVLESPEEVTLGGLAGMIQDKWRKLRPNAEPLDIKKLLDDDHETDDLDADMTVADVFVDNGLSQRDSRDQRGTVRVIQKPTPHAPTRFPSVSLDWDAAAQNYDRQVQTKKEGTATFIKKFPPILEEGSQGESVAGSQSSTSHQDSSRLRTPTSYDEDRRQDTPVKSVEKDDEKEDEIPGSPSRWREESGVDEEDLQDHNEGIVAATPQQNRMESQELGDSPTPTRPSTLRKHGRTSTSKPPSATAKNNPAANRTTTANSAPKSFPPTQKKDLLRDHRKTRSQSQHLSEETAQIDVDHGKEEAREKEQDQDGDVVMEEGDAVAKEGQPPFNTDIVADAEVAEKDTRDGDLPETRLSKRKNNQEDTQSNKEPRLDKAGTPTASKDNDTLIAREAEARKTSPCSLRTRRYIPSFCEMGNRSRLLHTVSPSKTGIGLGITKSPGYKKLAKLNSAQDSSNKGEPSSSQMVASAIATPEFSSSDPSVRRSSLKSKNPIPSNTDNSVGKAKPPHSALRKDSPVKPSKRSVSFSGGDKVIPDLRPNSKATPHNAGKKPKETLSSDGKFGLAGMVFPAGVPREKINQMYDEQLAKRDRKDEYEQKAKEAEEQNVEPEHLRVLWEMYETYSSIVDHDMDNSKKAAERVSWLRARMEELQKVLDVFEAKVNAPSKQPEKYGTPESTQQKKRSTPSSAKGSAKKTENTPKQATSKQHTPAPEPRTKGSTKKTNPNGSESMPKEITPAPAPAPAPALSPTGASAKQTKERSHGGASERASPKQATPKQTTPPQATPAPAPAPLSSAKSSVKRTKVGDREPTPKQPTPEQPASTAVDAKETKKETVPPAAASGDVADQGPGETAPQPQKKSDQSIPTEKAQQKHQAPLSSVRTRRSTQMMSKATGDAEKPSETDSQPEQQPQPQPEPDPELESLLQAHSATCYQPQGPQQPQSQQSLSQTVEGPQPSQQPEQPQELEQSQKEPSQSSVMASDGKLENSITRLVKSKDSNQPATGLKPKVSSPKQPENESSSSESETESESEDSDDEDDQQPNGSSSARKSPAPPQSQPLPQNSFSSPFQWYQTPWQSQPQTRTLGFQPINRQMPPTRNGVPNLKTMLSNQKEEHEVRLRKTREASTQKKDVFEPPSNSESEDESESDSDSDESRSSADDGDIQPGGVVGKLRHVARKK